jgi:biotin operon repressor
MGRKAKFYPSQFEDCLRNHVDPISKRKISEEIGCSDETTRKNLKKLRRDGVPVLPLRTGMALKDHVKKLPEAIEIMKFGKWMLDVFVGMLIINEVAQKPLLEAGRIALKKLPKDEQKLVRDMMYKLAHLSSNAEIDGLLEEENKDIPMQLGA